MVSDSHLTECQITDPWPFRTLCSTECLNSLLIDIVLNLSVDFILIYQVSPRGVATGFAGQKHRGLYHFLGIDVLIVGNDWP